MNFWERIKLWLKGEASPPKQPTVADLEEIRRIPVPASGSPNQSSIVIEDPGDVIFPTDNSIDVHQILFSHKNKHIANMLNSISFSSDMKTLYLIDNGKAIAYDLTVPEGVLVGLLGKQLVVATAISPPPVITPPIDSATGDGAIRPQISRDTADDGVKDKVERYEFKASKESQYTITYNPEHETLGIIGYDDIVINIAAPEDKLKERRFEIKNNNLVRIIYIDGVLQIFEEKIQ